MPPRKSNLAKSKCALCGAKDVSEPRGEERYCRDCWEKKIAVEEIVAREFALKRYIRAHSAEKYLIYHSTIKRPCGQIIVVDDGYDLFLTIVLYPEFRVGRSRRITSRAIPKGGSFAEILVDVVATEVIEPWGGGKWHLEIFRSANPDAGRLERRNVSAYNPPLTGRSCVCRRKYDDEIANCISLLAVSCAPSLLWRQRAHSQRQAKPATPAPGGSAAAPAKSSSAGPRRGGARYQAGHQAHRQRDRDDHQGQEPGRRLDRRAEDQTSSGTTRAATR